MFLLLPSVPLVREVIYFAVGPSRRVDHRPGPKRRLECSWAFIFSTLATIANVWRGVGIQAKLVHAAGVLFDKQLGVPDLFIVLPGRCLRGRWGSVDEVEALVIKVRKYLPLLFQYLFIPKGLRELGPVYLQGLELTRHKSLAKTRKSIDTLPHKHCRTPSLWCWYWCLTSSPPRDTFSDGSKNKSDRRR